MDEFKQVVTNLKERKKKIESFSQLKDEVEEDWDTFRHFVKIIQIVGELIIKNEQYEDVLKKEVQEIVFYRSKEILSESLEHQKNLTLLSFCNFKEYLLEENDRHKLNNLLSIIESGNF